MATIVVTVTETGFANVSRTLTLTDADLDQSIDAYNRDASLAIFGGERGQPAGTASRNQTLNYMFNTLIVDAMQRKTQSFNTQPAVVPPPIVIS